MSRESSPATPRTLADISGMRSLVRRTVAAVMPAAVEKIHGVLGYAPGAVWADELVWDGRLAGRPVAPALVLFPRPAPPAAAPASP